MLPKRTLIPLSSQSRDTVFYQEVQAKNISNSLQLHVTEAKFLVNAVTSLDIPHLHPALIHVVKALPHAWHSENNGA